jgi:hypothetical protein
MKMDKYYTAFLFEGYTPEELHVTHKYFGEQTPERMIAIWEIVDWWFSENPFRSFVPVFNRVDLFGPENNIRVLTPSLSLNETLRITDFLPGLREKINIFRKDDFGEYRAHVATDLPEIVDKKVDRYALIKGKEIQNVWFPGGLGIVGR